MSWIRRNWPDLLIVLFILALIAGFVVVLMGGAGSLFGNRTNTPSSTSSSTASSVVETRSNPPSPAAPVQETVPAAPGTEPPTPEPFPTPEPDSSGATSTTPAPETGATTSGTTGGSDKPNSSSTSSSPNETATVKPDTVKPNTVPAIPIIPAQPAPSVSSTPESTVPTTPKPSVEVAPVRPAPRPALVEPPTVQTEPVRPVVPRVEPAPRPQQPRVNTPRVQASRVGVPTKSDFRISAGLYSSAASAQAVADKISSLGYPVYVLPSKDDTQVVLVGPFRSRGDANSASGDISRVHQNLFVYAPSSESASSTSSNSETAPQTSSNEVNTPAPSSTLRTQGSSTPSSGTSYLQVGAYSTQSGADKLLETLRSSGYSPSTRLSSSGLIRVLVGPFSSGELDAAKGKLSSEGVDSFTVRSN
ncbi:MAG: SPOR domain-containing protein [Pseudopedobacter sp.]|nr:SPOR domain-containing protein [Deinococcales bacterium]